MKVWEMRVSERAQQVEIRVFLVNDQNIMLGYPPAMENSKDRQMSINYFWLIIEEKLIDPFLLKEYNLFSQNNESSFEQ